MICAFAVVDKINGLDLSWKAALTVDNMGRCVHNYGTGIIKLNSTEKKKLLAQLLTADGFIAPNRRQSGQSQLATESKQKTRMVVGTVVPRIPSQGPLESAEGGLSLRGHGTKLVKAQDVFVPGYDVDLYSPPASYDARDTLPGELQCNSFNALDQGDCDSCYAFGVVSTYSNRLCMRNRTSLGNVVISAQQLINCNGGCGGADELTVFQSLVTSAPVESWCDPYTGSPVACGSSICKSSRTFPALAGSLRVVGGATPAGIRWMQMEVLRGGPGTLTFNVFGDLFGYTSGVYTVSPDAVFAGAHAVSMVGWGTDPGSGMDYWVIQNSWSAGWGENGYFRIRRGTDESGIEAGGLILPQPAPLTKCLASNCPDNAITLSNCACKCLNGFTGPKCNVCTLVCLNGGIRPSASCTACTCPLGFFGVRCESGVKMAPYASCETSGQPAAVSINVTFGEGFPAVTQGSYFGFMEVQEYGTWQISDPFYVCGPSSDFSMKVNGGLCPSGTTALQTPSAPSNPGHYKLVLVPYVIYNPSDPTMNFYPAFIDGSATVAFYTVVECNATSTLAPALVANNPVATLQAEAAAAAAAAAAAQVEMTARLSASQSLIQVLKAEAPAAVTLPPLSTAYPWIWFGGQPQPVCYTLPPSININPKQLVLLTAGGGAYSNTLLGPEANPLPLAAAACINFTVPASVGPGSFTMALEDSTSGNYIAGVSFTGDIVSLSYSGLAYSLGPKGWVELTVTWSLSQAHATKHDVIKLMDQSGNVVVTFKTAVKGAVVASGSTVFKISYPQPPALPYPPGGFVANFYPNGNTLWAATALDWIPWSALGW